MYPVNAKVVVPNTWMPQCKSNHLFGITFRPNRAMNTAVGAEMSNAVNMKEANAKKIRYESKCQTYVQISVLSNTNFTMCYDKFLIRRQSILRVVVYSIFWGRGRRRRRWWWWRRRRWIWRHQKNRLGTSEVMLRQRSTRIVIRGVCIAESPNETLIWADWDDWPLYRQITFDDCNHCAILNTTRWVECEIILSCRSWFGIFSCATLGNCDSAVTVRPCYL